MPRRGRKPKPARLATSAGVRLQRFLADAGVASRRVCEEMITAGHVTVNGTTVRTLPVFIDPQHDDIRVDGKGIRKSERHVYVLLHKPPRALATTRDEEFAGAKRTTLTDLVDHPAGSRLFPIGRLEYHASGLVLLTNDGELANRLTHPRYGISRTYELLVKRALTQADLDQIERAFDRDIKRSRQPVSAVRLRLVKHDGDRSLIELTLQEGPNRKVADVLARLGCPIKRLRRTAIGPLTLKGVASGQWRELQRQEVAALMKAAKPKSAESTRAQAE